ncbi:MAG: hypothetical protein AAF593_12060 [Planctomycetota bacterium]
MLLRYTFALLLVVAVSPLAAYAAVEFSNTARFGVLDDPNNPFLNELDPNAQSALYSERVLLNFPQLAPFNLIEELEREINANTPPPPPLETYRQQSRFVSNDLFELDTGNVNGDLDAIPGLYFEERFYGTGPGDLNSFDSLGGSVGGFSGKLVSGILAPAGSLSSNDQALVNRIRLRSTNLTEPTNVTMKVEMNLGSTFEAQPNAYATEAVTVSIYDPDEPAFFLPSSQRSSEVYDTVPGGFGIPGFGTLFDTDEYSFPETNEIRREAWGTYEFETTLAPGEESTLEFALTFFTQVSNGSSFPAQLDNTQSLDFALNIFGDGIEIEYLPVPEPAALALFALGAPLVARRQRA